MSAVTSPIRDAYREGAAAGVRATTPPSDDGSGGSTPPRPPQTPSWATTLARRQRLRDAGFLAAQALREGDRPAGAPGPDLKDKS
jgi:type IV secretion system protein TrbL